MRLDIDRLFRGLHPPTSGLIVAVSGGSDSLSLLLLAKAYADSRPAGLPLLAVTVDHGLRPESADEARTVAALCAARGIAHRTMVWHGDKPPTGLSAASREARYALLAQAAADFGTDCILTGHTMDDQAETVAMRAQRGAGAGLAGMARATLFDERVWIVRPLLDVRRQELRAYLQTHDVRWIDDPSNQNRAYERVRIRATLSDDEIETGAAEVRAAGAARRTLANACALLLERCVTFPAPGLIRIDRALFARDDAAAIQALRVLLACAGGCVYLPDQARVAALFSNITAGSVRVSLSRALVDARKDAVWLRREARGVPDSPVAGTTIWDGRWRVSGIKATAGLRIAALGAGNVPEPASETPGIPASLVRAASALEPAVYSDGVCLGAVGNGHVAGHGVTVKRIIAPYARYLPDFDLAIADMLAHLSGNSAVPTSPWKHHIDP